MEYEQLSKGYEYGLQKIYEMVINNDPCYAYLMRVATPMVDQKLVMAHVYGHCDFFKNNFWFQPHQPQDDGRDGQPRHPRPAVHGQARRREGRGLHRRCLSLENLIDIHSPFIRRTPDPKRAERGGRRATSGCEGFQVDREYMDGYINPPEFLEAQRKKVEDEKAKAKQFPERARSATCCSSCWSTRRSSRGSSTCSRSSARRPTTSRRRARRRS